MAQLHITPKTGFLALIGFYSSTILHIVAAIAAFLCIKPQRHVPALVLGILLIIFANIFTDWTTVSFITVAVNLIPGALIAGGALLNKQSLES